MPDPFETLRAPIAPVQPDPDFAARLRARVARALDRPKGAAMPTAPLTARRAPAITGAVLTPYLVVSGAHAALDWYGEAFGARVRGEPVVMPDGTIGHAELDLAGATLMLSEGSAGSGVAPPDPERGAAVTLHLSVDDVDAAIARAVAAGARLERSAADYEHGRNGVVVDPFGHRWLIAAAPPALRLRHGDIGYAALWVPDAGRAAAFYSAVLGWRYAPGSGPDARLVEGLSRPLGLVGGRGPTLFCCYAVADVHGAAEAVRAAGGTAGEPEPRSYGVLVECVDDQGVDFALYQPPEGVADGAPPLAATAPGDLAYVTMEVVDSVRARDFYGAVLGWRFAPGRVEDGWQVHDVSPMVGISGGHAAGVTVPMFRVGDVAGAVEAVRAGGGSATHPERQPYGVTSTCTDDQGTRFYLGQL